MARSLTSEPVHVDELGRVSGLEAGALLATLLELELKGIVRSLPGKRFQLA